jgi:outer membrane receptor protein involved in Fe transport
MPADSDVYANATTPSSVAGITTRAKVAATPTAFPAQGTSPLRITPSLEVADDRWSDVNPAAAFPYIKTGAYTLLDLDATYAFPRDVEVSLGFKNLLDDYYELAWGYPQQGRTFYVKTRMRY